MLTYDPNNSTLDVPSSDFLERWKDYKPAQAPSSHLSARRLWRRVKRLWCKCFHNAFMNPREGKALCGVCLEVWEVDL